MSCWFPGAGTLWTRLRDPAANDVHGQGGAFWAASQQHLSHVYRKRTPMIQYRASRVHMGRSSSKPRVHYQIDWRRWPRYSPFWGYTRLHELATFPGWTFLPCVRIGTKHSLRSKHHPTCERTKNPKKAPYKQVMLFSRDSVRVVPL
jgi:hypothetical protein